MTCWVRLGKYSNWCWRTRTFSRFWLRQTDKRTNIYTLRNSRLSGTRFVWHFSSVVKNIESCLFLFIVSEVIQNRGHHKASDWWALGILIFEMLAGKQQKKNILKMHSISSIYFKVIHHFTIMINFLPIKRLFRVKSNFLVISIMQSNNYSENYFILIKHIVSARRKTVPKRSNANHGSSASLGSMFTTNDSNHRISRILNQLVIHKISNRTMNLILN
mgnify:CR=1 FL=1